VKHYRLVTYTRSGNSKHDWLGVTQAGTALSTRSTVGSTAPIAVYLGRAYWQAVRAGAADFRALVASGERGGRRVAHRYINIVIAVWSQNIR
jgi:hypothetical protein